METELGITINTPFRLNEDNMRKIACLLEEQIGPVEVKVVCKDNAVRKFETIDELAAYDNHDKRKILELKISAYCQRTDCNSHSRTAILRFCSEFSSIFNFSNHSVIYVVIEGQDDWVTAIRTQIYDLIITLKPWYSKYTKFQEKHLTPVLLILITFTTLFLLTFAGLVKIPNSVNEWSRAGDYILLYGLVGMILIYPNAKISEKMMNLRFRYFPSGVFLLGHQIYVETILDKRRHFIVTGFFVSCVLGALSLIISVL